MDAYTKEKIFLAEALEKAAGALISEAARLNVIARSHRACAASWRRLSKNIATTPHLVDWLKAKGSNDPFGQAAAIMDTYPDFVEAHYERFMKASALRDRRVRNREIVRQAKNGLTNQRLADRFGVSRSTVKRALKASNLGEYVKSPHN